MTINQTNHQYQCDKKINGIFQPDTENVCGGSMPVLSTHMTFQIMVPIKRDLWRGPLIPFYLWRNFSVQKRAAGLMFCPPRENFSSFDVSSGKSVSQWVCRDVLMQSDMFPVLSFKQAEKLLFKNKYASLFRYVVESRHSRLKVTTIVSSLFLTARRHLLVVSGKVSQLEGGGPEVGAP